MSADAADIAVMREQGDLKTYLLALSGRTPTATKSAAEPDRPGYHIPRKGAWPCGTAASGPTPPPCTDCASTTALAHPTGPDARKATT